LIGYPCAPDFASEYVYEARYHLFAIACHSPDDG
jgi:hypothetical protein